MAKWRDEAILIEEPKWRSEAIAIDDEMQSPYMGEGYAQARSTLPRTEDGGRFRGHGSTVSWAPVSLGEKIMSDPVMDVLGILPFSPLHDWRKKGAEEAKRKLRTSDYGQRQYAMGGHGFPGFRPARPKQTTEQLTKIIEDQAELEARGETIPAAIAGGIADLPAYMTEMYAGGIGKVKSVPGAVKFATKMTALQPHRIDSALIDQIDRGETGGMALAKAWGDVYIENISETAGAGIGKVVSKLPFGGKLMEGMRKFAKSKGISDSEFWKTVGTKVGYNGFLGEWGEERIGTYLRGLLGVQDFGAGKDATFDERIAAGFEQDFKARNMLIETGVLLAPGAVKFAGQKILGPEPGRKTPYEPEPGRKEVIPPISEAVDTSGLPPVSAEKPTQPTPTTKITTEMPTTVTPVEALKGKEPVPEVAKGQIVSPAPVEQPPGVSVEQETGRVETEGQEEPPVKKPEVSGEAKQAWEMTRGEFEEHPVGFQRAFAGRSGLKPNQRIRTPQQEKRANQLRTTPGGYGGDAASDTYWDGTRDLHKEIIQQALSENKPVPREVLEDYKSEPWAQEALESLKLKTKTSKPKVVPAAAEKGKGEVAKVYYHGTTGKVAGNIQTKGFKPKITNGQYFGSGVYLTPDKAEAANYGEAVIPISVNLKNPFILDMNKYRSVEDWYDEIQDDIEMPLKDDYGDAITVHTLNLEGGKLSKLKPEAVEAAEAITGYLQEKGHDGVIVRETGKPDEIVVFDPKQVSLAPAEAVEVKKGILPKEKPITIAGTFFHNTDRETAELILEEGFKVEDAATLSEAERGLVEGNLGAGVYLSPDYTENMNQWGGESNLQVKPKRPLKLYSLGSEEGDASITLDKVDKIKEQGYDGIIVNDPHPRSGGYQIVVFDPSLLKIESIVEDTDLSGVELAERKIESEIQAAPAGQEAPGLSHAQIVEQAVKEGLPVPAEVLTEYPDLAPAEAKVKNRYEGIDTDTKDKLLKQIYGRAGVDVVIDKEIRSRYEELKDSFTAEEKEEFKEVTGILDKRIAKMEAKQPPAPPAAAKPETKTGPITKAEKDALRDQGYKLSEILKMTPQEARAKLEGEFTADPAIEGKAAGEPGFAGVSGRPGGKVAKPWLTMDKTKSPDKDIEDFFGRTKRPPYSKKFSSLIDKIDVGLRERFVLAHHIPRTKENAIFIDMIRTMPEERRASRERAIKHIIAVLNGDGTVQALDTAGFDLLRRKIFTQDLLYEAKIDRSVPGNLKIESLEAENKRLDDLINQVPSVKKAYDARQKLWNEVSQDLLERGVLDEESANNQAYVRHFVLDLAEKNRPTGYLKKRLSAPYRAYSKRRKGSKRDISTDYLEVETKALADIYADNSVEDVANEIAELADKRKEYTTEARKGNIKKAGQPPTELKGFAVDKWLREKLGKEYITSEKLAERDGYVEYHYKRPNLFYRAQTITEAHIAAFVENNASEAGALIGIPAEKMHEALVLGRRKGWIIPEWLAAQLDDLPVNKRNGYIVRSFTKPFIQFWKRWILRINALRYNFRNLLGDTERFVVSGQESAIKDIPAALKVLITKEGEEYELMKRHGTINSSLWHEMNDVSKIKEFERFKNFSKRKTFKTAVRSVLAAPLKGVSMIGSLEQNLTQMREDILRAAVFLNNYHKLQEGKSVHHWAGKVAYINEIAKIDKARAASKISRETLGDYGAFTPFEADVLRQGFLPFYSWMKINTLFWPRVLASAAKEGTLGKSLTAAAPRVGLNVATWMVRALWIYAAAYWWNHRDDEAEKKEATLPFWLRAMPHLNIGNTTLWGQTALSDFVEWADAVELASIYWRRDAGFLTMKQAALEASKIIAQAPVNKIYQAFNPFMKAPIMAIGGVETYPSVFKARTVAQPSSQKSFERAVLDILGSDAKKFYQTATGDRKLEDTLYAYFAGWWARPMSPEQLIEELQRTKDAKWGPVLKNKSPTTNRLPGLAKKGREAEWQEYKIREQALNETVE